MGRPKGSKNKSTIARSVAEQKKAARNFVCLTCGTHYSNQPKNFVASHSPVYAANGGRVATCITCMNKMLQEYYNELGSEKKAMRKLCSKFDIYWSESVFAKACASPASSDIIRAYVSMAALTPNSTKNFYDTLAEEDAERSMSDEEISANIRKADTLTPDVYERWGLGYTVDELKLAEDKYNTLLEQSGSEVDETEGTLLRDLVNADILKGRAMKRGDVDEYSKCSKMYRDILKETEFKNKKNNTTSKEIESWGKFIQEVENFCPADLYKRPSLFEDVDKIGEYFQRFIVRPVMNFFTGQRDMDEEYSIGQGD